MFFSRIRDFFAQEIAIDLGTVNTLLALKGHGIIMRERSAVALKAGTDRSIIAIGDEAVNMLGYTPGDVIVKNPLKDGVIADWQLAQELLRYFMLKALGKKLPGMFMRIVMCVPGCVTEVESRALEDAARSAGAREAYTMKESMAAAIGAGLPVDDAVASMIVDIGGGTTDIAVIAFGSIITEHSIRVGGTHLDKSIMEHIANEYALNISSKTAETVKLTIGSALLGGVERMEICGMDKETGLPRSIEINSGEITFAMRRPLNSIIAAIREVLAASPPEVAGDLYNTGITLTGGGALLDGMAEFVKHETGGMKVKVADDALDCVILGALDMVSRLSGRKSYASRRHDMSMRTDFS